MSGHWKECPVADPIPAPMVSHMEVGIFSFWRRLKRALMESWIPMRILELRQEYKCIVFSIFILQQGHLVDASGIVFDYFVKSCSWAPVFAILVMSFT